MGHPTPWHRLSGADGLRGIACLIVLLGHAIVFWRRDLAPYVAGCGKIGVWLFFSLSAFLLTMRLERTGVGKAALLDYATSRFLRIYPAFAFAAVLYLAFGVSIPNAETLAAVLTLTRGPIHFWTIPVEVAFYALLPLAYLAFSTLRGHGDAALLTGLCACIGLHQFVWPYWDTPENSISITWYLPTFWCGMAAAMLHSRKPSATLSVALPLLIVTAIMLATPLGRELVLDIPPTPYLMDKQLYFGVAFAIILWCIVGRDSIAVRWIDNRFLVFVGSISYSTYLLHWLVMRQIEAFFPTGYAVTLAAMIAAALGAGAISYSLIEKPGVGLRKHRAALPRVS